MSRLQSAADRNVYPTERQPQLGAAAGYNLGRSLLTDLCIFIVLFAASFGVAVWVLTLSARLAGSARAGWRQGVLAAFLTSVCSVAFFALTAWVKMRDSGPTLLFGVVWLLVIENAVAYLIYRRVFRLSVGKALVPWAATLGLGLVEFVLVVALLRPFVVEAFVVPTGSMAPTIEPGGRVMVSKLLRPRRWDIVAYRTNFQGPSVYCKRVIGLPGERLRFESGNLYVDDKLMVPPAVLAGHFKVFEDSYAYPVHYHEGQTITLGKNEFFFIGDNADISLDSRLLGPSDCSTIVGVVDLIYWPLSRFRIVR